MKTHRTLSLVVVVVSAFVAVGCGSSSSSSSSGGGGDGSSTSSGHMNTDVACTFTEAGAQSCIQYANLEQAQVDGVKQSCSAEPGGMVVDSCPTDKLLGCCEEMTGGFDESTCYYQANGLTADSLEMACKQGNGMWSTSP